MSSHLPILLIFLVQYFYTLYFIIAIAKYSFVMGIMVLYWNFSRSNSAVSMNCLSWTSLVVRECFKTSEEMVGDNFKNLVSGVYTCI